MSAFPLRSVKLLAFILCLVPDPARAQTYTIQTIAGGGLPVNIPGKSASLGNVCSVASDAAGNLFLSLCAYRIVARLDAATGMLSLVAGNGTTGSSGDGGRATGAQLAPGNLALDASGNVYVVDGFSGTIRVITNGKITTVAGGGTLSSDCNNCPATKAWLNDASGLAVDSSGNLYIAESSRSFVRKVANGIITVFAGNGQGGYAGDNGPATSAEIGRPVALALDAGNNLYIADQNSSTIRKVSNGVITTFAGTGPSGFFCGGITDGTPAIMASLCSPTGVAADSAGNVYISDMGIATVLEVSNGLITTVSGGPYPPCDNCPATSTQLQLVNSLAVDPSNNLFIADSVRVRKVANGIITTPAGDGNSIGDGGAPLSAQLEQPVALAVDSTGANLYIGGTARVRKISGHVIHTVAGNGSTYILKNDGDHGPALSAQMSPNALALDASGNLYIADTEDNEIREVSNGGIASFAGSGALPPNTLAQTNNGAPAANAELNAPRAVAVDSSGNLYLTDNYNAVREVSNGIINVVAGNGTLGCGGQNGPALDAQFGNAWGLAVDAQASLYVLNAGCGDILKISNGTVTNLATIRGSALAVDPSGNAFIAGGNSVYKVSGGVLTTIAGTGTAGFSGDGAPALNALLDSPLGLAVDASGKVYVADLGNNRIRVLTPSGPSCSYSVDPTSSTINGDGGSLTVNVQAASGCAWAVQNLPNWITLSVSATGSGPASLVLDIAFNSGATRSVPLSIAGLAVTVSQSGSAISIATGGIVNAASYQSPVAAGSIAAVFGVFPFSSTFSATSFPLPTSADGFTLQLTDTLLAPLFVATAGQVNIQIPWELSGQSQATLTVPSTGASQSFNLAAYAPGIFAINGQGNGQGAIVDTAYHVVDASNPAVAGSSIVQIYCTGLGPVVSQEMTGEPNAINLSGATTTTPVVTIGGAAAQVSYSGLAPNLVGLYQVNAQVPATATRGPAVPVSLSIGGVVSNSVTIAIQ